MDNLDEIINIRLEFEKKGLTFYIHVDGAWGGYFASCVSPKNFNKVPSVREAVKAVKL